jgi:hypothetical protein
MQSDPTSSVPPKARLVVGRAVRLPVCETEREVARSGDSAIGRASGVRNPLGIIALFLGLSELTTGVAAVRADGWVQALFAVFSVALPVAVGCAFFTFLWKKPFVLYAPADYPVHTPVAAFVDAVTANQTRELQARDSAVAAAVEQIVTAVTTPASPVQGGTIDKEALVERAVTTARKEVESQTISIATGGIHPQAPEQTVRFAATERTDVEALSDFVYFAIADYVQPYKYGEQWLLKNADTGTRYPDMGRQWARSHGKKRDDRTLAEVGIELGAQLEVVPLGTRFVHF